MFDFEVRRGTTINDERQSGRDWEGLKPLVLPVPFQISQKAALKTTLTAQLYRLKSVYMYREMTTLGTAFTAKKYISLQYRLEHQMEKSYGDIQ